MTGFWENLNNALIWFNTERLSQMVDSIDSTSDGLYKDSLNNLRKKLKKAQSDDEKFIVVKQIHKLAQLHSGYLRFKEKNLKEWTKNQLKAMLQEVPALIKWDETYKLWDLYSTMKEVSEKDAWNLNVSKWKVTQVENKEASIQVKHVKEVRKEKKLENNHMSTILEILALPETSKIIGLVLDELVWLEVNFKWKKIVFTKEYIKENRKVLEENFKKMMAFIVDVESNGNPKVSNMQWSSAMWLGQWLVWNGRWKTEKGWKKTRLTSSFETSLNSVISKYWNNKLVKKELPFLPQKTILSKTDMSPVELSPKEQLYLLMLDITSNTKKSNNGSKVDDFLWLALLWNTWWVKEIYNIFHHTKPDKRTKILVTQEFKKYKDDFIQLALN